MNLGVSILKGGFSDLSITKHACIYITFTFKNEEEFIGDATSLEEILLGAIFEFVNDFIETRIEGLREIGGNQILLLKHRLTYFLLDFVS